MSTYIINNCPAILRMTKICDAYEIAERIKTLLSELELVKESEG